MSVGKLALSVAELPLSARALALSKRQPALSTLAPSLSASEPESAFAAQRSNARQLSLSKLEPPRAEAALILCAPAKFATAPPLA